MRCHAGVGEIQLPGAVDGYADGIRTDAADLLAEAPPRELNHPRA